MRTLVAALLVLVLAHLVACDASPGPRPEPLVASDDVAGGSRLKARWVGGPDGPVAPITNGAAFFDEVLGEPCDFGLASDGVLRCLAGHRRGSVPMARVRASSARYADPGCKDVIIDRTPGCAPPPRWLTSDDATACPVTIRVSRPGVKLAPGAPVYEQTPAGCALSTRVAGAEDWTLVEEDPATFAAAVELDGPLTVGLSERLIVSEDGARQAIGLRPEGEAWSGVPGLAADGTTRLLPSGPQISTYGGFADQACSAPAMWGSCLSPGQRGITRQLLDDCRSGAVVHVIGEQVQQRYDALTCQPSAVGTTPVFSSSERLAGTLPEALPLPATARLQQPGFRVGEGWSWRQGFVIDAALGEQVSATTLADGVTRWTPIWSLGFWPTQGEADAWTFADPACTQRLIPYLAAAATCRTPSRWAFELAPASCLARATPWTTEAWAGGELFTRTGSGGSCLAGVPDAAYRYRRLLAPADPTIFAPAPELLR